MMPPRLRSFLVGASASLLLLAPAAAHASSPGDIVLPRDLRVNLFGACFTTPDTGWVAGDLGRIFRTEDGGKTWLRQDTGGLRPFFSIACVDDQHVWLSTTDGAVYATTDGGATWTKQQTPVERNLLQVRFANTKRGTAVGDFGQVVHTEDGGVTWQDVGLPKDFKLPDMALDMGVAPNDALLYGMSYADENNVWVSGEFGTIIMSSDGGQTWTQQKTGLESTLFGIHMRDAQNGMAVGIDSVILTTTDGGENWKPIRGPFQERPYYDVVISGQIGWIVGGQGTLLTTSDGGATWGVFETPIEMASEWFRGLSLSGETGYLVGGAGLVYRSDGTEATLLGAETETKRIIEHGG
ncbi:MAG: YCF48-related protein [Candidatus Binatia bacterium]|nr:YCF48-related protein [Candidatus Binatia bacterium]